MDDALPLPPELAVADPPIDPDLLERWATYVVEAAEDAAMDPDSYARELAGDTDDAEGTRGYVPEAVRAWSISGDNTAQWAMAHVAQLAADRAALEAQAAEWTARIQAWFSHRVKPMEAKAAFFTAHLERYALAVREAGGPKTLTLPSGVVRTTGTGPTVAVTDDAAVMGWAKVYGHREVIKVTEKVQVRELRNHASVVEVPTSLVISPCGCIVTGEFSWPIGTAVDCPGCEADGIVGQWRTTELAVRDNDGRAVPGTTVDPGSVSARVIPDVA